MELRKKRVTEILKREGWLLLTSQEKHRKKGFEIMVTIGEFEEMIFPLNKKEIIKIEFIRQL